GLGLFATGQFGVPGPNGADTSVVVKGLFWGGGVHQLWAQVVGSFIMTSATLILAFGLMYGVKLTRTLRISEEGELAGIDIHEHGAPAYHPEFGFMGTSGVGAGPSSPVSAAATAYASARAPVG